MRMNLPWFAEVMCVQSENLIYMACCFTSRSVGWVELNDRTSLLSLGPNPLRETPVIIVTQ